MSDVTSGLLDTSVVVDFDVLDPATLPESTAVAATAVANGLPLYTRNPADFEPVQGIVDVVAV